MKNNVVMYTVAAVVGVGSITSLVLAGYSARRTKKLTKKLDTTLDKLMEKTEVNISESIIETAVNAKVDKVVTNEVTSAAKKAVKSIEEDMHNTIKKEVSDSVKDRSEAIERGIKDEYDKLLSAIDITDLKKEIKAEAKKKMMKQLDGTFDILVGEQSENLAKLNKIYDSIAGAITRKA